MDLQQIFYFMGIIFMGLLIIMMLIIGIALFYIKKKIEELQRNIDEKLAFLSKVTSQPGEIAVSVGSAVAKTAIKKVSKIFKKEN